MPKYFLTVILEDSKKEFPIIDVAMSLGTVVDSQNLKFQHNSMVAVFHFASEVNKKDLYVYIQGVLMDITETFLLTEVNDDVTVSFPKDLKSYMLDLENGEGYTVSSINYIAYDEFSDENGQFSIENSWFSGNHQIDEDYDDEFDDLDEMEDILKKIKNKLIPPTLDCVLDKIIDQGMDSLTKTELKVLKQYSN